MELGLKRPALGTALACCILFKTSLPELFPGFAEFVERDVLARARKLHMELQENLNRETASSHIADIINRLG